MWGVVAYVVFIAWRSALLAQTVPVLQRSHLRCKRVWSTSGQHVEAHGGEGVWGASTVLCRSPLRY